MALPSNYRQIAMMGMSSGAPRRGFGCGSRVSIGNAFLRDRLIRSAPAFGSKSSGEGSGGSPFSTPHHGHPNFSPQKIGGSKYNSSAENRSIKPPKAPDKPLMPYMRYSRKVWDNVKATYPELKLWEIGKKIRAMWKELSEADKQEFVDEFEAEKTEYDKAIKAYHASPSYQAYLNAKNKGSHSVDDKDPLDRSGSGSKMDRRIDIQPAEDDEVDPDDALSVKRFSHARYVRNQRLINEVFSDTVVPDVRTVVTSQRLSVLKRQVQSLTLHQEKLDQRVTFLIKKKLETELEQIESKFSEKKRKFTEAGRVFQVDLKKVKLTAPNLDEASFTLLIEKQKEAIKKESEDKQKNLQTANSNSTFKSSSPSPDVSANPPAASAVSPTPQVPTPNPPTSVSPNCTSATAASPNTVSSTPQTTDGNSDTMTNPVMDLDNPEQNPQPTNPNQSFNTQASGDQNEQTQYKSLNSEQSNSEAPSHAHNDHQPVINGVNGEEAKANGTQADEMAENSQGSSENGPDSAGTNQNGLDSVTTSSN